MVSPAPSSLLTLVSVIYLHSPGIGYLPLAWACPSLSEASLLWGTVGGVSVLLVSLDAFGPAKARLSWLQGRTGWSSLAVTLYISCVIMGEK